LRDLLADGVECGLHRIERLMRLQAIRPSDTSAQLSSNATWD
jgi:putative transposase